MDNKLKISLAVAIGRSGEIGLSNALLWHLPGDLQYFKRLTMGRCLIMGRRTFESIGRALPGRASIVISRDEDFLSKLEKTENCIAARSIDDALVLAKGIEKDFITHPDEAFVVGGEQIYRQFIDRKLVDTVYLTRVDGDFEADVYFPIEKLQNWKETIIEKHDKDDKNSYSFSYYKLSK